MSVSRAPLVLLALALGFVAGALPWGLWLGRWVRGLDVRTVGSRNLGATNVYRTLGPGLGIATLVLDIAKGALPAWLVPRAPWAADFPGGAAWCATAVGLAAIAGHVWTPFAGFKGGKGVATTVGVLLALSPPAFGAFVLTFVAVVGVTRYISLGSVLGSVAFAVTLVIASPAWPASPAVPFGVLVAALVIARHRDNLARLARGEERRFTFRGGGSA